MLGDAYVTLDELRAYMGMADAPATFDDQMHDAIASSSTDIVMFCHRDFNTADSISARIYEPNGYGRVVTDDFSTATGLIVQTDSDNDGVFETTWDASDYVLKPLNGIRQGTTGWPYWEIQAVGPKSFPMCPNRPTVQITALWGWKAVPSPVHQACLIRSAETFQIKDSRFGVAGADEFGTVVMLKDNRVAAGMLTRFRRDSVLVDG